MSTKTLNYDELPDQTIPRLKALVEHSAPNPERPQLPEESEKRLAEVERKTAAVYCEMEEKTKRIHMHARARRNRKRVAK
jgi:hypothetical protein